MWECVNALVNAGMQYKCVNAGIEPIINFSQWHILAKSCKTTLYAFAKSCIFSHINLQKVVFLYQEIIV